MEVYVVAYPKSGVTWLIHLLCDLLDSPQQDIPGGPIVGRWGVRCDGGYMMRKSHDAYGSRFAGKIVVFTQRDPRDVIVSTSHYCRWSMDSAAKYVTGNYESWIRPWLNSGAVITRYRWLHDRPTEELRRIARAITGNTPTDEHIQAALDRQSFENMIRQLSGDKHFMRRGVVGDWRNHLNQKQGKRINKALGNFMLEQGFIDNLGWWRDLPG